MVFSVGKRFFAFHARQPGHRDDASRPAVFPADAGLSGESFSVVNTALEDPRRLHFPGLEHQSALLLRGPGEKDVAKNAKRTDFGLQRHTKRLAGVVQNFPRTALRPTGELASPDDSSIAVPKSGELGTYSPSWVPAT